MNTTVHQTVCFTFFFFSYFGNVSGNEKWCKRVPLCTVLFWCNTIQLLDVDHHPLAFLRLQQNLPVEADVFLGSLKSVSICLAMTIPELRSTFEIWREPIRHKALFIMVSYPDVVSIQIPLLPLCLIDFMLLFPKQLLFLYTLSLQGINCFPFF